MAKKIIRTGTTADPTGDSLKNAFVKVNDNFTELYNALGLDADLLNLGAFEFTGSVMTTTDSSAIVIDQATTITSNLSVGGDILPQTANGGDLGSSTLPWRSLYVSNNTIYIGGTAVGLDANGNLTTGGTVVGSTPAWANITGKPTIPTSFDRLVNGANTVSLDANGNLTFPQGTLLGYSDPGGFIINGAVDKDIAIYTYNGADAHGWTFGTDGSLTIPGDIKSNGNINIDINLSDSTLRRWQFGEDGNLTLPAGGDIVDSSGQSVLGGGSGSSTVVRQDTPPSADNGTLWFNTLEGRLYIKYSDAWIDAAPLMTPAPDTDIDVASITFPDASVQTTAFTGTASTDRLVNGDNELVLESNGNLTIPGAITNDNGIEMITDRGTVQFGYNLEVPGVASHFHINKVGSFDLFLGDDSDYVKLPSNGGVEIQSGQGLWTFGTDGSLTIPGGITGNNDINITVDNDDSSTYTWNFDRTGDLTAPGDITTGLDGVGGRFIQDCADGTTSMRWINVNQGDDTTQLIRAYTGDPKLNTEVERAQIKLNWDQTEDKSGLTIRTFDQSNPNNEVDHDWLFKGDGVLQLPVGGDIVDSEGNSVLGGGDDNNIWVQTFVSNDPAVDFPNIATSVEYDSEGNVIALFVHTIDLTGERYFTVGKYTAAGTKIWTARLSDDSTTDGWGLAVDNAGGWIYVAGAVDGAGYPYRQATLTKIDAATGDAEWYRIYDFGYDSSSAVVDVDSSGHPVIVGYVDIDPSDFASESYLAVTKVNKTTGAVTWSRKLDGQADEKAYGMAVGPTGEVVAVGYMDQLTGVDTDDRMVVVKYLSDGTIDWQRAIQFDAGWTSTGYDADIDSQGNVYICGQYTFDFDGGSGSAIGIVKLDSSGAKQWSRRVVGDCVSLASSIVVGPDDKLYISGITGNDVGDVAYTWLVAKFDFNGLVEWQRFIENTGTWTFSGQFFGGEGGGSNLAVRQGYVALAGGFGDLEAGDEPMAAVIQVSSTGNVFSVGNWNFTSASLSGTLNSTASDITVINAGLTDSNNVSAITSSVVGITTEVGNFLIGTVLTAPGGNDSLVNGAYLVSLSNTGVVTLPAGGTITEGYVTSNPTIQLTPAAPTVASQKLVIKGGGGYINIENGITVTVDHILRTEGSTITVYVESVDNADQTLYWWTYPATANGGVGGTVALDEFGDGSFSFTVDNADYEFKVRVSPEDNNYGPGVIGAQSVLINGDEPTFGDDHHLHLTTGNLTETSIFLGTDDHNVRTTTDGGVEITTPNGGVWQFGTDGNLTIPGNIRSESNINIDINLSDSTLRRWQFGEDGDTVFPTNISINYSGGNVQFPRIIADSGKAFSVQGQGASGSAAMSWTVDPDAAGQYAAVGVTKEGGDNLAKVVLQAQSNSGDAATVKLWKFDETGALTIPGDIRSEGNINIDINLSDSTLHRWQFGEDGSLTFPDATVQTTALVQGEQIFTLDTGAIDYAPTVVDFNLLFVTPAIGYSEIDPTSVTLPNGVPGQRLVIFNGYNLATLTVNPGPVGRDISGGVVAEFIYSGFDGLWMPLYGTNSPT